MTSKNTNRLKRSPVRKAPLSPISWNWKSGWKCAPARCQRASENTSAARPEHAGQHQHQGGQPVQHQHDAEQRRPVAEPVDAHGAVRAQGSASARQQQRDRHGEQRERRREAERGLEGAPPLADQHHQRPGQERDDDRRDRQVLHPAAQRSGSLPSTWSVPVKPRAASSTTRNSAVVAKLMTMAVRTSACGSGSAYWARSPAPPRSRIGCRTSAEPARREDEQVDGVGQQRKADDHLKGARPQQQPDAGSRQHADREGDDDLHYSSATVAGAGMASRGMAAGRGTARWPRTDW